MFGFFKFFDKKNRELVGNDTLNINQVLLFCYHFVSCLNNLLYICNPLKRKLIKIN